MSTASSPPVPGRAHPDAGKKDLTDLLSALVKIALVDQGAATLPWRQDATDAQRRIAGATAALATLRLDDVWAMAVKTAERDPAVRRGETVNPTLPAMSPLGLDQLGAEPFDLDGAVQAIRDVASFG